MEETKRGLTDEIDNQPADEDLRPNEQSVRACMTAKRHSIAAFAKRFAWFVPVRQTTSCRMTQPGAGVQK
jgi:uncharacterized protein YmfQ (DUF2313 family)